MNSAIKVMLSDFIVVLIRFELIGCGSGVMNLLL